MRRSGPHGARGQRRRVPSGRRTTVADAAATPVLARVDRAFAPAAIGGPDRVWLAGITNVAAREGWRYLAVVLDVFSRRVVGSAMANHPRTELVLAAL